MPRKRLLSGVRPTGPQHLGNYVGALRNWVALQDEFDCFFLSADWHALTSENRGSKELHRFARENVAEWIAAGVDPNRATLFVQSDVPEHAELHLLLSTITPVGWLERVPTYKAQLKELEARGVDNYAFLGYPVLQAADIFLYKAEAVPVGEDQLPHLELTREIARRFNATFGPVFPEPRARLTNVPLLLGIDGRKMSKSYGNSIELGEPLASVEKKVRTMYTDPARQKRTDPGHPEICNVWTFHSVFGPPERHAAIGTECRTAAIGCTDCKAELAGRLLEWLRPIRERREEILSRPRELDEILAAGAARARAAARETMNEVREAVFGGR
jgi:tryptophanyl-tRNA synthetase